MTFCTLYFLDSASGKHLASSPSKHLLEFTITLPLSSFLCSNAGVHPRIASSFIFVSFLDGYQIYYQVDIHLYVWPLSPWVYLSSHAMTGVPIFLSLGRCPLVSLVDLLTRPAMCSWQSRHYLSPLRLEPLGSQYQPVMDQSCYVSENCRGWPTIKEASRHFSRLPISAKVLHALHTAVCPNSHREIFPNRHDR